MLGGSAGKIYKLLTDDIVERRLEPVTCLDRSSRFALLNPNFMVFACTHRLAIASIMLSSPSKFLPVLVDLTRDFTSGFAATAMHRVDA
jgi:hypothetical protein